MINTEVEKLKAFWESDKLRAEFMCKMNWSEARMIKYEKCCHEHENGTIKDLTFNLFAFWIGWAVILVNFLPFFYKWLPPIKISNSVILIATATLFFGSIAANPLIVKLRKFYYKSILKLPAFFPSARAAEEARKNVEFALTEIRSAQFDIRRYKSPAWMIKAEAREESGKRQEEQALWLLEQLEKQSEDWLLELNTKYAVRNPAAAKRAMKIRIEQAEQREKWHAEWETEQNTSTMEHEEWKAARGTKLRELLAPNANREKKVETEQVVDMHISVEDPIKSIQDLAPRLRLPPRIIDGPSYDRTRNNPVSERPKSSISSLENIDHEITSPLEAVNVALSGILERGPLLERKEPEEFVPLIGSHGFQELVVPDPEPTYAIGDERFAPPPGFRIRFPVESVPVLEPDPELGTVLEPGLIEPDSKFVPEPAPESELALEPGAVVVPEPELPPELVFEATAEPVPVLPHTQTLPPKEPEPDEREPANLTRTRTPRAKVDPEFDSEPAIEGRRKLRTNYAVVRNPKLRIMAIQIHGRSCCVCGFNFDAFFGKELAQGYIEVHHLNNVASGERTTDPATDLAPLCANCHAMADRLTLNLESPPRSIPELRELLIPSSNRQTDEDSPARDVGLSDAD